MASCFALCFLLFPQELEWDTFNCVPNKPQKSPLFNLLLKPHLKTINVITQAFGASYSCPFNRHTQTAVTGIALGSSPHLNPLCFS